MKPDFKFCDRHWTAIRAEIARAGLTAFVSKNGKEAAEKMRLDPVCLHTRQSFDPLMAAHNLIVLKATDKAGYFKGCPIDYAGEIAIKEAIAVVIDHARGLGFMS